MRNIDGASQVPSHNNERALTLNVSRLDVKNCVIAFRVKRFENTVILQSGDNGLQALQI